MFTDFRVPINEVPFAAIDFESTGASQGHPDVPVQIGWARMRGGEIDTSSLRREFLKTDQQITLQAFQVHAISSQHLQKAQPLSFYWPDLHRDFSQSVVVAHGHGTEKRFLRAFPTHGFGPWLDTLGLARKCCIGFGKYDLRSVVAGLGVEAHLRKLCPVLNWHDALFDAVASLMVLRAIIEFGDMGKRPISYLLDAE
ncbi:MAG: exonuclease domain-containing protein [Candidatus Methylacidiphilales bacterium]